MVNVKINEDTLIDLLLTRLEDWTHDETALKLFGDMYENYAYDGCFEGMELDIWAIVDNDWVNYCHIIEEGDDNYSEVLKLYEEQGLCDISCDTCYSSIEAISDDKKSILVRC